MSEIDICTGRGGFNGNHMARRRAQDWPLPQLHEQHKWLRGAEKKVSGGAIEFFIMYSQELLGLGDLELPAPVMQTPE